MRNVTAIVARFLLLAVVLSGSVCRSQDQPPAGDAPEKTPDWQRALVEVGTDEPGSGYTGIVVSADKSTVQVLTIWEYHSGAALVSSTKDEKFFVTATSADGKQHRLDATLKNYLSFSPMMMQPNMTRYLALVEAQHDGLNLTAARLANEAPAVDDSLRAIFLHGDPDSGRPVVESASLLNELDPASNFTRYGELSISEWGQDSLLAVMTNDGTLTGIARHKPQDSSGGGGGFGGGTGGFGGGGGGFGGGGGGFFSMPDPRAQFGGGEGFAQQQVPPLTFVAVVDCARQLKDLGVPVPDEILKVETQRRRIHNDSFGRPVQSKELQITWSDDHKELHGFSITRGEWAKLKIDERDMIVPIVGSKVAAVSLDGSIAAYSGDKGTWDVVSLRPGSQVPPSISSDVVTVRDGDNYYTFAASSGVWTSPTDANYQMYVEGADFNGSLSELNRALQEAGNRATIQKGEKESSVVVSGTRHHVRRAIEILRKLQPNPLSVNENDTAPQEIPSALSLLMKKEKELQESLGYSHPDTVKVREQVEAMIRGSRNKLSLLLMREAEMSQLHGPSHPEVLKIRKQLDIIFAERYDVVPGRSTSLSRPAASEDDSLTLAARLRESTEDDSDDIDQLGELVAKSFDERLGQQKQLAERLEERLRDVRKAIQAREANRKRIIERRVEELLNPDIDWSRLSPAERPSSPAAPGMSASGVPIGLPGPPHLPVGDPLSASENDAEAATSVHPSSAEIVRDLNERRRFAVGLTADRLRAAQKNLSYWLQPLEAIQRDKKDSDIDANLVSRNVQSMVAEVERLQEELRRWMSEWKVSWRRYETALKKAELKVQDAELKLSLAKTESKRAKELFLINAADISEATKAETNVTLAQNELARAELDLKELQRIAEDSPQLDPGQFETESLLADPTSSEEK